MMIKTCKECGHHYMHCPSPGKWICEKCEAVLEEPVLCENCGKRNATLVWVGEGGVLAWTHGMGSNWCETCSVEAQLAHAQRMAANIPKLEQQLEDLRRKEISEFFDKVKDVDGISHIIASADALSEDLEKLEKRIRIINSIMEAKEAGLYEVSEHLASDIDLEMDDE